MKQQTAQGTGDQSAKRAYEKPVLVVHGTVAELTQAGGRRRRDGLLTRAPS
ncbi:MAG: lasso RiPP family leader peptide-containing protein [Polyangiaceae bacterium]|nr:lasso RiPP family leader peptide-containing protein [Polyangiaceae bacterium]